MNSKMVESSSGKTKAQSQKETSAHIQKVCRNGPDMSSPDGNRSIPSIRGFDEMAVGKYRLIKTIGKGNFAKVKLAKHIPTGEEVAIKIIDKTKMNASSLQKLLREVRIMKRLNHPNIVKLYEVIETDQMLYLVLEYAKEGELFDYLVSHGRMKESEARAKFRQIVSAIQYCHQKNILHRDLKAENLLMDANFNIKIADFGFSNEFVLGNKMDTFCGSPPYAAPELFQGRKYDGPEVDVWSLGVILYTLVSGSLPFDGQNLKELRERVVRGKYRIPFFLSTSCESLLKKFLVLNPLKRASLDMIMKDPWMNIGHDDKPLKPFHEPPQIFDDLRIDAMVKMGFARRDIEESLVLNKYDNLTATYLLLCSKNKDKEESSSRRSSSVSAREKGHLVKENVTCDDAINLPTLPIIASAIRSASSANEQNATRKLSPTPTSDDAVAKQQSKQATLKSAVCNEKMNESLGSESIERYSPIDSKIIQDDSKELSQVAVDLKQPSANRPTEPLYDRDRPKTKENAVERSKSTSYHRPVLVQQSNDKKPDEISIAASSVASNSKFVRGFKIRNTVSGTNSNSLGRPSEGIEPIAIGIQSTRMSFLDKLALKFNRRSTFIRKSTTQEPKIERYSDSTDQEKPRSLRFTWSMKMTSMLDAKEIRREIMRVLDINNYDYELHCAFLVHVVCHDPQSSDAVEWQMEICKLPRLACHGVRLKRIAGTSSAFKSITSKVAKELKL